MPNFTLPRVVEEDWGDVLASYTPVDLRSLTWLSIDEIYLGDDLNSRLREHGLINVGKIADSTREYIASILGCNEMVGIVEARLEELGLDFDMKFHPSVISDEEYHLCDRQQDPDT